MEINTTNLLSTKMVTQKNMTKIIDHYITFVDIGRIVNHHCLNKLSFHSYILVSHLKFFIFEFSIKMKKDFCVFDYDYFI